MLWRRAVRRPTLYAQEYGFQSERETNKGPAQVCILLGSPELYLSRISEVLLNRCSTPSLDYITWRSMICIGVVLHAC